MTGVQDTAENIVIEYDGRAGKENMIEEVKIRLRLVKFQARLCCYRYIFANSCTMHIDKTDYE